MCKIIPYRPRTRQRQFWDPLGNHPLHVHCFVTGYIFFFINKIKTILKKDSFLLQLTSVVEWDCNRMWSFWMSEAWRKSHKHSVLQTKGLTRCQSTPQPEGSSMWGRDGDSAATSSTDRADDIHVQSSKSHTDGPLDRQTHDSHCSHPSSHLRSVNPDVQS